MTGSGWSGSPSHERSAGCRHRICRRPRRAILDVRRRRRRRAARSQLGGGRSSAVRVGRDRARRAARPGGALPAPHPPVGRPHRRGRRGRGHLAGRGDDHAAGRPCPAPPAWWAGRLRRARPPGRQHPVRAAARSVAPAPCPPRAQLGALGGCDGHGQRAVRRRPSAEAGDRCDGRVQRPGRDRPRTDPATDPETTRPASRRPRLERRSGSGWPSRHRCRSCSAWAMSRPVGASSSCAEPWPRSPRPCSSWSGPVAPSVSRSGRRPRRCRTPIGSGSCRVSRPRRSRPGRPLPTWPRCRSSRRPSTTA